MTGTTTLFLPERMPADFSFVAGWGNEARNVIDTSAGMLTMDYYPYGDPVTIELALPPEVLEDLYLYLVGMQRTWQTFTTEFAPDPEPDNTGPTAYWDDHSTIRLEWRAADFESLPILWQAATTTDPEAVALSGWFGALILFIEATPEYQAIPKAEIDDPFVGN